MLQKLTPKQVELMQEVRDEYLAAFFTDHKPIDKEEVSRGVDFIYGLAGLKAPLKIFVSSPLGAQYAVHILKQIMESGAQVWDQVRDQVRDQVGDQVWDQVRDQVGDQVRDQVRAQVGDQVRDQVRAQVGDQVGAQVWDQVRDQVRAQVWAQVWDQVRDQVRAQVGAQVWDQVRAQKLEFFSFSSYGSIWDYGWVSFYDFFQRIGIVKLPAFDTFKNTIKAGVYDMIQLESICIICELPKHISRDTAHRMHGEHGAAISWHDGYELHYLHGVHLDKELWTKITTKQLTFKEVMGIDNMEQRMVALKFLDPDTLLKGANAELIQKTPLGNELFLIKDLFPTADKAYFLRYECPSTARIYISGVAPDIGEKQDADLAMAWKHNMTKEEYLGLKVQT